jgi:hypothetical protein
MVTKSTSPINQSILDIVGELKIAVLGYNGTPGLVSDVRSLTEYVKMLDGKINELSNSGCKVGRSIHAEPPATPAPKDTDKVTFQWLLEKLGVPVVTGVTTALLVAALIFYLKP